VLVVPDSLVSFGAPMATRSPKIIIPTHVTTLSVASQNSISPYLESEVRNTDKSGFAQGCKVGVLRIVPPNIERIECDWKDGKYRNPYSGWNRLRGAPETY